MIREKALTAGLSLLLALASGFARAGLSGDINGDGAVDLADYSIEFGCLGSPGDKVTQPLCDLARFDPDIDVDLADFAGFQNRFGCEPCDTNLPPILGTLTDQTVDIGSSLSFIVSASDPDGDPVQLSVLPLPLMSYATFDAATGLFSFRPDPTQVGPHLLTFLAGDGSLVDSQQVVITVRHVLTSTTIAGRVLDTNDFVNGIETPVIGARVSILNYAATATTNAQGVFSLTGLGFPTGNQVLDIDTRQAQAAPDGSPYAGFREAFEVFPNVENQVSRPFFLPRVETESLTTIDPGRPTDVCNKRLGVCLHVSPGSAKNPNGTPFTGQLSISEVARALAPAPLPEELQGGFLITIQPVGITFNPVAKITFPNRDGLPPGSEVDIWSLDAGTGKFIVVGTGCVNESGDAIETIAGGIRAADWHEPASPQPEGDSKGEDSCGGQCCGTATGSMTSFATGNLSEEHVLASYRSQGRTRSLRFVYNSTAADPRPILQSDSTIPLRAAVPLLASASLSIGGVDLGSETFVDTSGFSEHIDETFRQAVQFDASMLPTSIYPIRLKLTSHYARSAISGMVFSSVVVNNGRNSPFGAGWGLAGLQRLHDMGDGRILITDGDGSTVVFTIADSPVLIPQGQVVVIDPPPPSVNDNQFVSLTEIRIFRERQNITLAGSIQVDATSPRSYDDSSDLTPAAIPAGTVVNSFLVHADDGSTVTTVFHGAITFGSPILGVIATSAKLNATDATLGAAGTTYYTGGTRDIEFSQQDAFIISGDRRTLTVTMDERSGGMDELRVLTAETTSGPSYYEPRAGDFSTLNPVPGQGFVRRMKDGTELVFDTGGVMTEVRDRNGNSTGYHYVGGNLARMTDPVGLETQFTYSNGRLSSIVDPANRVTMFTIDSRGDLIQIDDPDESGREFGYDGRHKLIWQRSKRGYLTTYSYDFAGRHGESASPDNSTRKVKPAATVALIDTSSGLGTKANPAPPVRPAEAVATFMDGDGFTTTYRLDGFGAPTETVDPLQRRTIIERDNDGLPVNIVWPNGRMDDMTYDDRGNLWRIREAMGTPHERQMLFEEYDPVSNQPGKITDAAGKVTRIQYDANGNPEVVTDPLGFQRISTYFANGLLMTSRDENLHVTTYTYDAKGLLDTVWDAENSVTDYGRDAYGNVASITEGLSTADVRTRSFGYGVLNRMESATDGEQNTWHFRYDDQGNLSETETPTGEVTRREYDALDRVTLIDDPITGPTAFAYDHRGNVTRRTDAVSNPTVFDYDGAGQLRQTTDALGGIESYDYDRMGNIAAFTDANRHTTTFGYDVLNRRTSRTNPLNQTAIYTNDSRDNLKTHTKPDGQVIVYDYDDRSRLKKITTPDNVIDYDYDGVGNLTVADDLDSRLHFTYDNVNRVKTAATLTGPGTVQPAVTLIYGYDAVGNRRSLSDSLGATTLYDYDAVGRLTRITTPESDIIEEDYDPTGRLHHIYYPNGITAEYDYDVQGRLARLTHTSASETLLDFAYAHNPVGNITSITEPARVRTFSYDALHRLRTGGSPDAPEFYNYDPVGNRTSSHLFATHVHDAANRLLQDDDFSYTYDANGNLRTKTEHATLGVMTYTWTPQNQLLRVDLPDGTIARYIYDGLDRRIRKDVASDAKAYVYDGNVIRLEYEATAFAARFDHGQGIDQPLHVTRGSTDAFYFLDHLGSVNAICDGDGQVLNEYEYDAFGRVTPVQELLTNSLGYAGRDSDSETGLLYLRARYYDPSTSRFTSEDPIDVRVVQPNLYAYVLNNPQNAVDPFGLDVQYFWNWHFWVGVGPPGGPKVYFDFVPDRSQSYTPGHFFPFYSPGLIIPRDEKPNAIEVEFLFMQTTLEEDLAIIRDFLEAKSQAPFYSFPYNTCLSVPGRIVNDALGRLRSPPGPRGWFRTPFGNLPGGIYVPPIS